MSSLAVQNNLTTQYINEVKSELKCNFRSIIGKISLLVFPLILLVTFVIDLFSKSSTTASGASLKQEVTILLDKNISPSEKMAEFFDLVQNRTVDDILSTANELVKDVPTMMKVKVAIGNLMEDQEGTAPILQRMNNKYPDLMATVNLLQSAGESIDTY